METNQHWRNDAQRIIKALLKRNGVTYEDMVARLAAIGVEETVQGIKGKLHRGTFTFAWVLQCCAALDVHDLRVD